MKQYLTIIPFVFLVGCVSVPVERHWPKAPEALQTPAPALKEVPAGASASEVFDVVIENYGTYYDIANKLAGWQQWYVDQQKIFESVQ